MLTKENDELIIDVDVILKIIKFSETTLPINSFSFTLSRKQSNLDGIKKIVINFRVK